MPRTFMSLCATVERRPLISYLVYSGFLIVAAWFSMGWLQPDEHSRVIEPAHYLAYGFATLPWEFTTDRPMVSFLLGWIHAPVLMITRAFSLAGLTEAAVLRAFSGLICATRLIAFFKIVPLLGLNPRRQSLYTVLYAVSPFALLLFIRTSQENWASTALMWGLYLGLRASTVGSLPHASPTRSLPERSRYLLGAGVALALAAAFRPQVGVAAAFLTLTLMHMVGWRRSWPLVAGGLFGLLPKVLIDTHYSGGAFVPDWNYFLYALSGEEHGCVWGTFGPLFYVTGLLTTFYPPASLALFPIAFIGMRRRLVIAATIVPFTVIHFIIGHKELRYFSPILPVFFLAVFVGYERLETAGVWRRLAAWGRRRPTFYAFASRSAQAYLGFAMIFGVVAALVPLNPSPLLYDYVNKVAAARNAGASGVHDDLYYVADSRSGISLFYAKQPNLEYRQIGIDTFLASVRDGRQRAGIYVIYRMDTRDMHAVEKYCHLEFFSTGATYRRFLDRFWSVLRKRDVDGVARCPDGASSGATDLALRQR